VYKLLISHYLLLGKKYQLNVRLRTNGENYGAIFILTTRGVGFEPGVLLNHKTFDKIKERIPINITSKRPRNSSTSSST
jgi:hypothetical protein